MIQKLRNNNFQNFICNLQFRKIQFKFSWWRDEVKRDEGNWITVAIEIENFKNLYSKLKKVTSFEN